MISLLKEAFQGKPSSTSFPEMGPYLASLKKANLAIQKSDMVELDTVAENDPDRAIVNKKLTGEILFTSRKESKAFGTFIGTAIGDALGIFTEGLQLDYLRNNLKGFENAAEVAKDKFHVTNGRLGQYTAATSQTLCMADSLLALNLEYNGIDLRYRTFLWYYRGYNNGKKGETDSTAKNSTGIGLVTYNACVDFVRSPGDKVPTFGQKTDENGNGTIIRLAPIPIAFGEDLNKCMKYATDQSFTTHNGVEASQCCRLLSFVLWHFLNIESVDGCKAFLEQLGSSFYSDCKAVQSLAESKKEDDQSLASYNPKYNKTTADRNWDWKDADFKYSPHRSETGSLVGVYCMDATAMGLHIIYHTKSFKEAVLKAVNLGGDSVSVGALVGMLAGALYGFDDDMRKWYLDYVSKWDEKKCAIRAYKLEKPHEEKLIKQTQR